MELGYFIAPNLKKGTSMAFESYLPEIHENEEIKVFSRKHIMFLLMPLSTIATVFILPIVGVFILYNLSSFFSEYPVKNFIILIMSCYLLILCAAALFIWFRYYYSYLIVTDSRIIEIEQKSLFNRTTSELELLRIEDVKALVRGILATFLRYGDVLVETAGAEENNFLFQKLPNASYVSTQILELAQKSAGIHAPVLGGRAIGSNQEIPSFQKSPPNNGETNNQTVDKDAENVENKDSNSAETREENEENVLYERGKDDNYKQNNLG